MYWLKTKFGQIFLICMHYCDSGFSHAIQIGYEKIEWIDEDASVIKIFIGRSSSFQALQLELSYQNDEISTVLKQSMKGFAVTIRPAKPLCMAINEFNFLLATGLGNIISDEFRHIIFYLKMFFVNPELLRLWIFSSGVRVNALDSIMALFIRILV